MVGGSLEVKGKANSQNSNKDRHTDWPTLASLGGSPALSTEDKLQKMLASSSNNIK